MKRKPQHPEDYMPRSIPLWYPLYEALKKKSKLGWKKVMFIAWSSTPKRIRFPRTQEDLAISLFGLASDRVLRNWRAASPEIEQWISELTPIFAQFGVARAVEYVNNRPMESEPVREAGSAGFIAHA